MPRKTFVTNMPDKAGAFLLASNIIARFHGNIVRASFNKAVDLHTLFIDVQASEQALGEITKELENVGYLNNRISAVRVIVVNIRIPDVPGAVLPVLEILNRYDINISYINAGTDGTEYQDFKMGLLIENPKLIKSLLDEISQLYQIEIIDYDDVETSLDNTIFYIRLANEMRKLMGLSTEKTIEFLSESNRVLQRLQDTGENPAKVFDYIRRFAQYISGYRGAGFRVDVTRNDIGGVSIFSIQPPCGSNTYVLIDEKEMTLIDTGYALYYEEMTGVFDRLFPGWREKRKTVYITHADVDHCGLLSRLDGAVIRLSAKSADGLRRQRAGEPDYREQNELNFGYSKLSRIISGYMPPEDTNFELLDSEPPHTHEDLIRIGFTRIAGLDFEVLEGSGGHLFGETVYLCRKEGIVFTGDNLVNIRGFSPERAQFNSLAPYLMRSVNVDPDKALRMRKQIMALIEQVQRENAKPCIICGGHGPVCALENGTLAAYPGTQTV